MAQDDLDCCSLDPVHASLCWTDFQAVVRGEDTGNEPDGNESSAVAALRAQLRQALCENDMLQRLLGAMGSSVTVHGPDRVGL